MAQALRTWVRKRSRSSLRPHGGSTADRRPHGRDQRAGYEVVRGQFVRESLEVVVGRIDVGVRQRQEQVDAVELCPIYFGRRGEAQHGVEIDRRLGAGAFADDARPHRVVKGGRLVLRECS